MAGYLGTKAVLLSTTAASVGGDAAIGGDLTVDTNTLYVDSTNNKVGIGTTSIPAAARAVIDGGRFYVNSQDQYSVLLQNAGTSGGFIGTTSANTINFFNSSGTERMRIDGNGNLLVGTTSPYTSSGKIHVPIENATVGAWVSSSGSSLTRLHMRFENINGLVGSISTSGSSTAYNTSSDYRLKEDVQPVTGASDRVLALKPVNFAWKSDGTRVDGFLAHEAQEVVPEAVTGTKDAVDEEGNPEYQGIDQSKLVPLLTAALQEALTEITDLKARVTALETV